MLNSSLARLVCCSFAILVNTPILLRHLHVLCFCLLVFVVHEVADQVVEESHVPRRVAEQHHEILLFDEHARFDLDRFHESQDLFAFASGHAQVLLTLQRPRQTQSLGVERLVTRSRDVGLGRTDIGRGRLFAGQQQEIVRKQELIDVRTPDLERQER